MVGRSDEKGVSNGVTQHSILRRTTGNASGVRPGGEDTRSANASRGAPRHSVLQKTTGDVLTTVFNGADHFGEPHDSDDGFVAWFQHLEGKPYIARITCADRYKFIINRTARKAIYTNTVCLQSANPSASFRPEQGMSRHHRRTLEKHELHTTISNGHRAIQRLLNCSEFANYRVAIILRDQFHCTAVFAEKNDGQYRLVLFDTECSVRFQRFNELCGFFPRHSKRYVYTRQNITPHKCDYYSWEELEKFISHEGEYPFNGTDLHVHKMR